MQAGNTWSVTHQAVNDDSWGTCGDLSGCPAALCPHQVARTSASATAFASGFFPPTPSYGLGLQPEDLDLMKAGTSGLGPGSGAEARAERASTHVGAVPRCVLLLGLQQQQQQL